MKWFPLLLATLTASLVLSGCKEGPYPSRTVTVICPWAAGGGTDRLARFVADQLQAGFEGSPCIVVNRTGGAGASGHAAGATARPDGYTLTMATFELSTMHWMGISRLTYEDYDWLMQLNGDAAAILVKADSPWQTLADWLAHLKANPGASTMSGTAVGGAWDLARAGLLMEANLPVNSVIWVPAKGSAPAIVELLGGHVDAVCCSVPEAAPQIESGDLRVLCVMAEERLSNYPEFPTAKEQGVDWSAIGWRGLGLPKETPEEIRQTLLAKCEEIAASPAFADFMKKNGFNITVRGPEDFRAFLAEQDAQWKTVIEAAGLAAQP